MSEMVFYRTLEIIFSLPIPLILQLTIHGNHYIEFFLKNLPTILITPVMVLAVTPYLMTKISALKYSIRVDDLVDDTLV